MPRPALLAVVVVNYGSADLVRENVLPLVERLDDALLVIVDNRTTDAERSACASSPGTRRRACTASTRTRTRASGRA
ncbi:hypothetical protein [Clavibacter zhangzhiyongii]|uniref:hypothetical protein n=1 Tax=Clavibacter zhangzhiyongii TaxID=2768071 RepID=UPI0039DFC33D